MAVPTTNINLLTDVSPTLYGNIVNPTKRLSQFLCTANIALPNSLLDLGGCTQSLTKSTSSISFGSPGTCVVTITAKSAWCMVLTNTVSPPIYSIQTSGTGGKVTLAGTSGENAVYGGSGSISIYRNTTSCGFTSGTLTICYSNGSGGRSSQSISLITFY